MCLRQELRPRGVDVSIVAAGEFAAGNAWLSDTSMLEQVKFINYIILNYRVVNLPQETSTLI